MSEAQFEVSGTPDQIEKQLEELRTQLSSTVDQLADRVKPANLAADIKDSAIEQGQAAKTRVSEMIEGAKQGDRDAQKKVAIAGAVVVAIAGLAAWRIAR